MQSKGLIKPSELKETPQYSPNATLEDKVDAIADYMKHEFCFWNLRRTVKDALLGTRGVDVGDTERVKGAVIKMLEESGLATELCNTVYLYDKEARAKSLGSEKPGQPVAIQLPAAPVVEEPVECVESIRQQWDTRLRYELRSVGSKQKRKLVQLRDVNENKEAEDYLIRFVYTSEDLLETVKSISDSNLGGALSWGVVHTNLNTPSLPLLRHRYKELRQDSRQVGVDDLVMGCEWWAEERQATGSALVSEGYIPHVRHFAKTGVPNALRPRLWCKVLGVETGQTEMNYFETLLAQVQQWDLITDDLTRFDVQEAADSDEFFVFEEMLDEMMLAFTRDSQVPAASSIRLNTAVLRAVPSKNVNAGKRAGKNKLIESVPPNHIIPFHRQVMFAAPLCFMFPSADQAYFLFRAMYCRYWCRLATLSTEPDTILPLCKLFESLLQTRHPEAFYHAVNVGIQPLAVVFPWLFSAFAGWLEVEQVLLFWDRLVAFDSLELVAVLATAIFVFRAKLVLAATTAAEIQDIFCELSGMKVVPLLQSFLFSPRNS
jgi:hypothetical protein